MNTDIYSARSTANEFCITISNDDVHLYTGDAGNLRCYQILKGMFPVIHLPVVDSVTSAGDYAEVKGHYRRKG